ncbi:MAG: hypothetical protein IKY03_01075, partial [Clostridia bacterium]|nr:hypothetical protein [Clostridia bacterium]
MHSSSGSGQHPCVADFQFIFPWRCKYAINISTRNIDILTAKKYARSKAQQTLHITEGLLMVLFDTMPLGISRQIHPYGRTGFSHQDPSDPSPV